MTLTKYSHLIAMDQNLILTHSRLFSIFGYTIYGFNDKHHDSFYISRTKYSQSCKINSSNSKKQKNDVKKKDLNPCQSYRQIANKELLSGVVKKRIFRNLILNQIDVRLKKITGHSINSSFHKDSSHNDEYLIHVPDNCCDSDLNQRSRLYFINNAKLLDLWMYNREYLKDVDKARIGVPSTAVKSTPVNAQLERKQLFNFNMYLKYQNPCSLQVIVLENMFGDAEKLVSETISPLMSAGVNSLFSESVTSHLGGFYWKTSLTISWPHKITVTGIHMIKNEARKRAYLLLCESFKYYGLISLNASGQWQPVQCVQVLEMLEQLAEYGRISVRNARGRGFKVLLEQVKDQRHKSEFSTSITLENNLDIFDHHYFDRITTEKDTLSNIDIPTKRNNSDNFTDVCDNSKKLEDSLHFTNLCNVNERNLKWKCSVHVGWPKPFSAFSYGFSLPSTQLLALTATAVKLKRQGLLSKCNSKVCIQTLKNIVKNETAWMWVKQLDGVFNSSQVDQDADAELFCDISNSGMGAYLVQKDTETISWISEQWQDFTEASQVRFNSKAQRNSIFSQQAEVFAMLTAVFTWKKKLKHKKVLVFNDNSTAVGILNALSSLTFDIKCDSKDMLSKTFNLINNIYNIQLEAVWIDRSQNQLADKLSRQDHCVLYDVFPTASKNKTKPKKILLRGEMFNL